MKRRLLALLLATMVLPGCAAAETAGGLTLLALNVGKADCLLLESGGCVYMIDTGTAESWGAVSSALRQLEIRRLDGVILTHTDKDHAGGLWALAQSGVEVGAWYASAYYEGVKEKKHPAVLAAALRGQTVTWLKAGDELPLPGGSLRVIGPMSKSDKENNNSLVLVAEVPQGRMLLAGDMELPEEQELLAAGAIPPCEVLKVGNHAENDATGAALVAAVSPQVAVISTNSVSEPDTPAPSDSVLRYTPVSRDSLLCSAHDYCSQKHSGSLSAVPAPDSSNCSVSAVLRFPYWHNFSESFSSLLHPATFPPAFQTLSHFPSRDFPLVRVSHSVC